MTTPARRPRAILAASVAALALLAAVSAAEVRADDACPTVLDALQASPKFSTAVAAFRTAGLADMLGAAQSITLFAPDNAAFAKIPAWQLKPALGNPRLLRPIAAYHIATDRFSRAQLDQAQSVPTLNGEPIRVSVQRGGTILLDDRAAILGDGTTCGNGILYEIDAVLRP